MRVRSRAARDAIWKTFVVLPRERKFSYRTSLAHAYAVMEIRLLYVARKDVRQSLGCARAEGNEKM